MHNVLYMCLDTYIWIQRRKIGMRTFFCVYDLLFVKSWDTRFSDHSVLDFHVDASATYLVGLCPGHRRLLQHGGIPAGMATRGKIYKNADLSAFLYLCLNKSSCWDVTTGTGMPENMAKNVARFYNDRKKRWQFTKNLGLSICNRNDM